jgi:hypothetical protein
MKKVLFLVSFLLILGMTSSFAAGAGTGTTITYMGKRAGNGPFNPCKGATTRACYVEKVSVVPLENGSSNVTQIITLFDDGVIYSVETNSYIVEKPAGEIIQEKVQEHEQNGGSVEVWN